MRLVSIDFETANSFIGSICSVGIALIDNGKVVNKQSWFVKPHADYFYFDPFNTMIHGISEVDVVNAAEFNEVYKEIEPLLKDAILVAHNAAFDMSALRHVLQLYNISYPEVKYICTYKTAIKTWVGLDNYKLNTVCKFLNYQFKHHNAEEDAVACARILLSAMAYKSAQDVFELTNSIGMAIGMLFDGGYNPCSIKSKTEAKKVTAQTNEFDSEHEYFQKKVVFTGTLSSMTRKEAMQKVVNVGGLIGDTMTEDTDFLVMGMQDYSKFADGKESTKTKKAKSFISTGKQLQIIDEVEFLRHL